MFCSDHSDGRQLGNLFGHSESVSCEREQRGRVISGSKRGKEEIGGTRILTQDFNPRPRDDPTDESHLLSLSGIEEPSCQGELSGERL